LKTIKEWQTSIKSWPTQCLATTQQRVQKTSILNSRMYLMSSFEVRLMMWDTSINSSSSTNRRLEQLLQLKDKEISQVTTVHPINKTTLINLTCRNLSWKIYKLNSMGYRTNKFKLHRIGNLWRLNRNPDPYHFQDYKAFKLLRKD
jgi:hypothetical protein